ncbi:virion morphogenesis protein [Sphingomonas sp. Leaf24]|uniref:phage virion morphogenesis protein n=1 Tax=unclassified Sphingomonas TaxID=196159 RepID=UPI0006FAF33D|nr:MULTISPECIES: phage virion morphogenesis protein [unclassified Sphingomonas]KQM23128.1 virion morphogenesis protein [Sphingomonas sp. Leaf5]KQM95986.1 virion morphogenesis protein [Sphingomonas sp. Leaf24]
MTDGIAIDITIREDVTAAIGRLVAAGGDLSPVMGDIAGHLADTTRERFETSTDPDGVPWKPSRRVLGLDGSREGHGPFQLSGKTLVLSGDLMNSIVENWGKDFAEAGPEKSGGAGVYARIHQEGGTITPKNGKALSFGGRMLASVTIPARRYLGFNDTNADYVVGAIGDHLVASFAEVPAA